MRRCALNPTPVHPRIERLRRTMHDFHVHQSELVVVKLIWTAFSYVGWAQRLTPEARKEVVMVAFVLFLVCQWIRRCGCGHMGCYRKRWGEWEGIVEFWVLKTLQPDVYEQTTTVTCEYGTTKRGHQLGNELHVSSTNVCKVVVRKLSDGNSVSSHFAHFPPIRFQY